MLRRTTTTAVVLATTVLGLLSACGSSNGGGGGDRRFVGALLPETTDNTYSSAYVQAMQAEAAKDHINLKIYNAKYSASTQADQASELLAQNPDGVILWPADPTAAMAILTRAKAQSIPVDISNSEVPDEALALASVYTGPSNYKEGQAAAQLLAKSMNNTGSIVTIEGLAGNSTAVDRLAGFTDELAKIAPGIKILGSQPADWDKSKAISVTSSLLTRYGDQIDGVFAADDVMATGVTQALRTAGKKPGEIKVVGIGNAKAARPELVSGYLYGTVQQSPALDGQYAVSNMMKVLDGEQPAEKKIFIPIPPVTAENADQHPAEW